MTKDQYLGFQRGPRPEQSDQRQPDQAASFSHKAEALRDSASVASRIRFPTGTLDSPWQNGFAERLIGSIRRECVDHIIVLGEMHLRRILRSYADYYNRVRTHRSLNKDAPVSRPVQRTGVISSRAILGGLHHH